MTLAEQALQHNHPDPKINALQSCCNCISNTADKPISGAFETTYSARFLLIITTLADSGTL